MSATETPIVDANTIQQSPLGTELSAGQCERLSGIATAMGLETGMFLLEEGHRDDKIHVVSNGVLEVVKNTGGGDWVTLQILRDGDMAGELGFIDDIEHSAAIRAVTNTEVFSIGRAELETLLGEDPDLVYKVMRAIIRTVHGILRRMNTQFVEMQNYITRTHGRY